MLPIILALRRPWRVVVVGHDVAQANVLSNVHPAIRVALGEVNLRDAAISGVFFLSVTISFTGSTKVRW